MIEFPGFLKVYVEDIDDPNKQKDDKESLLAFGEDVVLKLCQTLIDNGVDSLHFYTMNRSEPIMNIIKKL